MTDSKYLKEELYGRYHGTVKTQAVTVSGTFRTPLPLDQLAGRRDFIMINPSSNTIYIGGEDVSVANGIPVISGTVFSAPLGRAELYGITPAAGLTSVIKIMEIA